MAPEQAQAMPASNKMMMAFGACSMFFPFVFITLIMVDKHVSEFYLLF